MVKRIFLPLIYSLFYCFIKAQSGPVAANATVTVNENASSTINIANYVTDTNGGSLTVNILIPVRHGTSVVTNGNNVIYTPNTGFIGSDSFTYQVCDTFAKCDTATIYLVVRGSNLAPVVVDDSYIFADTVTTPVLNVLANDHDPGNDTLYIAAVIDADS